MTKAQIKSLLLSNDRAVERAILALHARQTVGEQRTSTTKESNGVGFNCFHAERGSYYARWLLSGRHLTGSHLQRAREMVLHYTRQLSEMSEKPAVPPTRTYTFPTVQAMWDAIGRLDRFQEFPGVAWGA